MEFDKLKEKYTELRKRFLETQKDEYRERADWNILYGVCRDLEAEKEALKRQNEALLKDKEEIRKRLLHYEKLIKTEVYNDFNFILKEKEEKFNTEFSPIE